MLRIKNKKSSGNGKVDFSGSYGGRLLTKVDYSVAPRTIFHLATAAASDDGVKDALDPLTVQCSASPKASLKLAFDLLTKDAKGHRNFDVHLSDVDAPNMTLHIEATVEWYKRSLDANISSETDRSRWPAPEPPVKVTLDGKGHIGSFRYKTLVALTVHLEVYAVDGCSLSAVLGGLNAQRGVKTLTDVELRVDGQAFPAHRNVLAANSPVFCSMFTCGLKEAQEGVVNIEGTSSAAFAIFLEFLYTASIGDWKGCEIELLELADRYLVATLKAVCEERLLDMDWRTALGILEHADKPVISSDVRMRAMRVLVKSWDAVFITPQWKDFQAARPVLADAIRVAQNFYCLEKLPGPVNSSWVPGRPASPSYYYSPTSPSYSPTSPSYSPTSPVYISHPY